MPAARTLAFSRSRHAQATSCTSTAPGQLGEGDGSVRRGQNLGGVASLVRGVAAPVSATVGACVGLAFGCAFGGVRGRWLDVVFGPDEGGDD